MKEKETIVENKRCSQTLGQCRRRVMRAQKGYLMVSMTIVLFVTAALLTLYVERQAERSRLDRGEQVGYALSVLGTGLNAYLDENYTELAANKPVVTGIANPLQPKADELIRKLNISGVAAVPPVIAGASYRFLVSYPPGCTADQRRYEVRCRPSGLAYIDKPLKRGTKTDYVALARAARVMKGKGGYARPETPSQFTFPDSITAPPALSIANPTNVAGILAWRADTLPKDEEYLKTNGSNRMNSALRLNGKGVDHDLIGARDITASGLLRSKELRVSDDSTTGGNQTVEGRLEVKGGEPGSTWGVTINKDALIGGDFTVMGETRIDVLRFRKPHRVDEHCDQDISIAMDPFGRLLQCERQRWRLRDQGMSAEYIRFEAPGGFALDLNKFYFDLGNWAYCRDYAGSSILWTEGDLWRSSVFGNSGWHIVVCYGRQAG